MGWSDVNLQTVKACPPAQPIPMICIVVQGGVGTCDTVSGALKRKVPVLFIRGSGRAADFFADSMRVFQNWSPLDSATQRRMRSAKRVGVLTDALAPLIQELIEDTLALDHTVDDRFSKLRHVMETEYDIGGVNGLDDDGFAACLDALQRVAQVTPSVEDKAVNGHGKRMSILSTQYTRARLLREAPLCWVYDLNNPNASDLQGSMLSCILNPKRHTNKVEDLEEMLLLVVRWKRPEILRDILKEADRGNPRYVPAIEVALVEALCLGAESCVQTLIDYGADVTNLAVDRKHFRKPRAMRNVESAVQDRRRGCRQALIWKQLMKSCKQVQKSAHVVQIIAKVKQKYRDDSLMNSLSLQTVYTSNLKKKARWVIGMVKMLNRSTSRSPRPTIAFSREGTDEDVPLTYGTLRKIQKAARNDERYWKAKTMVYDDKSDMQFLDELFLANMTSVVKMDVIYAQILGVEWRYSYGMYGGAWDLFLWAILMNRPPIARMVWEKVEHPVVAALTACRLFRKLASLTNMKKDAATEMLEAAHTFEQIATRVQLLAMEDNSEQALEALEIPLGCWDGLTAYDLAVLSESTAFISQCCMEARDQRWYGDITAHSSVLGLPQWCAVVLSVLTLGVLAPLTFEFDLPPNSDATRPPACRRKIPRGFPDHPFQNKQLRERFESATKMLHIIKMKARMQRMKREGSVENDDFPMSVTRRERVHMTCFAAIQSAFEFLWRTKQRLHGSAEGLNTDEDEDEEDKSVDVMNKLQDNPNAYRNLSLKQKKDLWDPTFSYTERWLCFWRAPMVRFALGAIFHTSFVILFTNFITTLKDHSTPFSTLEGVVCVFMAGSMVMELRQVCGGLLDYCSDPWNMIDLCCLLLFWSAFTLRMQCLDGSCNLIFLYDTMPGTPDSSWAWASAREEVRNQVLRNEKALQLSELPRQLYGLAVFLVWLRLLHLYSVNKTLGPLVLALRRMGGDIVTFIFIWVVVLMAFASALYGGNTMSFEEQCADGEIHAKCWESWWIVRVFFQSFGEMFLDEMRDSVSVAIFMLLLIVLQLVLNNTVFVAVITSTFQSVWDDSQAQWTIELYHTTEEYMRYSRSFPVPINLLLLPYDIAWYLHNRSRVRQLTEREADAGLPATSSWRKHSRLTHARYATVDVVPYELRAETEEQELADGGDGPPDPAHLQKRNRVERDGRAIRRTRALLELARARFIAEARRTEAAAREPEVVQRELADVKRLLLRLQKHVVEATGGAPSGEGSDSPVQRRRGPPQRRQHGC